MADDMKSDKRTRLACCVICVLCLSVFARCAPNNHDICFLLLRFACAFESHEVLATDKERACEVLLDSVVPISSSLASLLECIRRKRRKLTIGPGPSSPHLRPHPRTARGSRPKPVQDQRPAHLLHRPKRDRQQRTAVQHRLHASDWPVAGERRMGQTRR